MGRVVKGFFPIYPPSTVAVWRRNIFPVYTPLLSPASLARFPCTPVARRLTRSTAVRTDPAERGPSGWPAYALAPNKMSDVDGRPRTPFQPNGSSRGAVSRLLSFAGCVRPCTRAFLRFLRPSPIYCLLTKSYCSGGPFVTRANA